MTNRPWSHALKEVPESLDALLLWAICPLAAPGSNSLQVFTGLRFTRSLVAVRLLAHDSTAATISTSAILHRDLTWLASPWRCCCCELQPHGAVQPQNAPWLHILTYTCPNSTAGTHPTLPVLPRVNWATHAVPQLTCKRSSTICRCSSTTSCTGLTCGCAPAYQAYSGLSGMVSQYSAWWSLSLIDCWGSIGHPINNQTIPCTEPQKARALQGVADRVPHLADGVLDSRK